MKSKWWSNHNMLLYRVNAMSILEPRTGTRLLFVDQDFEVFFFATEGNTQISPKVLTRKTGALLRNLLPLIKKDLGLLGFPNRGSSNSAEIVGAIRNNSAGKPSDFTPFECVIGRGNFDSAAKVSEHQMVLIPYVHSESNS